MTIRLTEDEFFGQFQEADEEQLQWDASDDLDVTYKFDARMAQGWWRDIWLREGIYLGINKAQHGDRTIVNYSEQEFNYVRCCFTLSGKLQESIVSKPDEILIPQIVGKYSLRSNGLNHQTVCDCSEKKPYFELNVSILPSILRSFAVSPEGELPQNLQHLVKTSEQPIYARSADIQPMMATLLQQILYCPYQGMVKRMYLESKVIELMGLVLDHEATIGQEELKTVSLKPDQIERIHYAKEILLQDLSNPPSLEKLAHQAGLNDFILKQGFRACFGTTVFGLLRSHRLEVAKQLLAQQNITVAEVAYRVGYASVPSFAKAFKRKFGLNPKQHQKACR
ncbi:MAG: AraC family transcriptional regulator [Cyanobacteria bacterium P01_G01_bin.49]